MKKFNLVIIFILVFQLLSCQKNTEDNLYIIDSIKLGSNKQQFQVDLMKYNLTKKTFYTSNCFISERQIGEHTISANITKTFNFDDSEKLNHFGVLMPDFGSFNNKLIGMLVLLGHSEITESCIDYSSISNITSIETFNYRVRRDYIEKIEKELIKKYGNPQRSTKIGTLFHGFVGKELKTFMTTEKENGEILQWNNKNIRILFYKGSPNDATYFLPSFKNYKKAINIVEYNEDKNNGAIPTVNNPFISYYLDEDYISKNNLKENNL